VAVQPRPERVRRRTATRAARRAIAFAAIVVAVGVTAGFGLVATRERDPDSPLRLAWFFRPPTDGTSVESIATRHAELILTGRSDLEYRDELRAAGWEGEVWQYVEQPFTAAPLDGPCGTFPERWELWDNQVAWNHRAGVAGSNDFCRLVHPHEDWMLHWPNGERVTRRYGNQIQYTMNPATPEWRDFFATRVERALERWDYDAIFLDDLWNDVARHGGFREYPTDEAYEQAVIGFVEYLRERIPGVRIVGNAERPEVYSPVLDGWFYEAFAGHWSNELQPADEIVGLWELAERDSADGKEVFLVAQGERGDEARARFAYAAYLMVAHPRVSFRYSHVDRYAELWDYPEYEIALGDPRGERRAAAPGVWRRDFEAGTALVNLSDAAAEVELEREHETVDGARVRLLTLPAKAGIVLRLAEAES
jgi:hypothetical protein